MSLNNIFKYTHYKSYIDFKKLKFVISHVLYYTRNTSKDKIKILDIGCGKGSISLPLASLGYSVMGIDLDSNIISNLNSINPFKNAHFIDGNIENMKIDDKFDFIICSEVLEHLKYPQKILISTKKILKEKGLIIITIPNGYGPWELLYNLPCKFVSYILSKIIHRIPKKGSQHIQSFSIKQFKKICNIIGLNIAKIGHSDFISGFPMLRGSNFAKYDSIIADRLPHKFVSGWYFIITMEHN